MGNTYYSYCCGKYVEKNSERPDLIDDGIIPIKGHHCSRCKKPLTCYGNPILEEDKKALREENKRVRKDNGIRGNKVEVRTDGLYLINKFYPKSELTDETQPWVENWVIFDHYGNYVSAIKINHRSTAFYEENEPFAARLKKAKLTAVRMNSFKYEPYISQLSCIDDLKYGDTLKQYLINMGWKFDSKGRLK